ncbi:MAG TPA: extracellular solute-binding protein [Candidatus Hydrogenedentes bacterium]|nr:extracellular solute-binding protein [Candidatus Hydrogenedentota bacterium]
MRIRAVMGAACLAFALCGCDALRRIPVGAGDMKIVEAAVFEGGYGIEWHRKVAGKYSEEHAGDHVRVELWGDPRVAEKIKPRLLRGDPPDLFLMLGLPVWMLIADGKLRDFNAALEKPAYGTATRWRDLFIPGTLDMFTSDGKVYALPSAFGAWACWYDARMFRRHGWTVPKTWREFDALCRAIRMAGVEPIAFQGKYPNYGWFTFVTLIQRCGGLAAINRINLFEPGAFSHPDVVHAARLTQEMARNHFQRGAMAMTHTESQLQFVNGHAAMIWCGIWLENEMKNSTPPGFEMRCFNVPAVEGGKGNPNLFNGMGAEWIFVPADARFPEEAQDFARYLVSPINAPDMGASIGVISPMRGATPRSAVSPALQSVLDMMDNAPGIFSVRADALFLEWTQEVMQPSLSALLRGESTPEQFCRRLDDGIAAACANPDAIIPPHVPYDPVRFGEQP